MLDLTQIKSKIGNLRQKFKTTLIKVSIVVMILLMLVPSKINSGGVHNTTTETQTTMFFNNLNKLSLSEEGRNVLLNFEGLVLSRDFDGYPKKITFELKDDCLYLAYRDAKGYWTHGIGHLIKKNEKYLINVKLTGLEVLEMFNKDIKHFENVVRDSINVELTQNQFDALVSFAYNVGEANFNRSLLVKELNCGMSDPTDIKKYFVYWKDGGLLLNRRIQEASLYNKPSVYGDQLFASNESLKINHY